MEVATWPGVHRREGRGLGGGGVRGAGPAAEETGGRGEEEEGGGREGEEGGGRKEDEREGGREGRRKVQREQGRGRSRGPRVPHFLPTLVRFPPSSPDWPRPARLALGREEKSAHFSSLPRRLWRFRAL